jgi:hypothetical protein
MADGWDVLINIVNAFSRFPIERLFDRGPSDKPLDALEAKLKEKGLLTGRQSMTAVPNHSSAHFGEQHQSIGIITREGLDPQTLVYQEQKAYNELWLAESHAKEDFLGCGTDVDCGFKHGLNFVAIALETKSMTTDPVWQEIEDLGWELQSKAHPDRVLERTHHQEYHELAIKISKPRSEIEKRLKVKRKPIPSLEEAKAEAAKLAQERVEKQWYSQEKK